MARITKATLRQEAALLPPGSDNYLCQECGLFKHCSHPYLRETYPQAYVPSLTDRILFVGSNPSAYEAAQGRQFVSPLGRCFKKHVLAAIGLHPYNCVFVSATACATHKSPSAPQILACRAFVLQSIEYIRPRKIVLLGTAAARSVLNLKEPVLKELTSIIHRVQAGNVNYPAIVTYSLAYVLKDGAILETIKHHIELFVQEKMEFKEWPNMFVL